MSQLYPCWAMILMRGATDLFGHSPSTSAPTVLAFFSHIRASSIEGSHMASIHLLVVILYTRHLIGFGRQPAKLNEQVRM